MRQIREILRLKYEQQFSHRAIAGACQVSLGTVSEYLGRSRRASLAWPLPAELDDTVLKARLFPPSGSTSQERVPPDLEHIHQELKLGGVTLHLLWEEYRETHPDGYGYSRFCEICRRWAKKLRPSMRQVHRAGEKVFIDFSGKRPHWVNPRTGDTVGAELFVAVLGASNYTYAEALPNQQLHDWIGAHNRMVEFFGGSVRVWGPDQLKSGVTVPYRYEPGIHHTYQEAAQHYGAVLIPARPRKARDKAKVEVGPQVVEEAWHAGVGGGEAAAASPLDEQRNGCALSLSRRPRGIAAADINAGGLD